MATLSGYATKMTGSAGQMTFKRVAGRTIVSEKSTTMRNPRTAAQQRHRMKWPNMIRMYSGISPLLRNAFEGKAAGVSDYNMFLKSNFGDQLSFLIVRQEVNVVTGYPQCSFEGYRVELDKESEVCLLDLVSAEGFAVKGGKLACQFGAGIDTSGAIS